MSTLMQRVKAKQPAKKKAPRKNGTRYGVPVAQADHMDFVYNGALAVIAKGKEDGTFHSTATKAAKKAEAAKFKLNRKETAKRVARLEQRLGVAADATNQPTTMETTMSTKSKVSKSSKPAVKKVNGNAKPKPTGDGYKGHRAGSLAAKAHKMIDDAAVVDEKLIARLIALGLKKNTAHHWCSLWAVAAK